MKAKMLSDTSITDLEERLNAFLETITANAWKLFDIKYDTFLSEGLELHSVLILYGVEDAA
jgi:hypothetical protein